ncbi:MAG: outer membrane lipoprotein carrier protein LolA [Sphingomonadaceae bacterium]|nr:outer membrane lipoprotein carrier protein LolA [Sphingomonadaceae bacterium]
MPRPILFFATLLAVAPLAAAPATIDDVRAALKATTTMTAGFRQTAANGATLTGKLLLARPGRIRFQYDKAPLLVVADGRKLSVVDYEVAQVSQWPVKSTPLGILLDSDADLAKVARVSGVVANGALVEAKDPRHPEYGAITLTFARDAAAPGGLTLTGWTALDAQNNRTEVTLNDVRYNVPVAGSSFAFRDPRPRGLPGKSG